MSSLPRDRNRGNWARKNELIIDFGGLNETENNKTSILWLSRLTFEKTLENKSEKTYLKSNSKKRNLIISSHATNNTAQWKKDESCR